MINQSEIDRMAGMLRVHPSHVQRDYVHGWLLSLLYQSSNLANRVVLKGCNALRKAYFENSRYSRDLDFSTSQGISHEELGRELNTVCEGIHKRSGVYFDTSKTRVDKKKLADSEKDISEARLYFRNFYGAESEIIIGVRLDVTQFDRLYLPVQERKLIHPYSDSDDCASTIRCVQLEEIYATKMRCLLQRKHIGDLFDLVYATIVEPALYIDRMALISTFFRITIFGSNPSVAKGLFIDLPLETLSHFWTKHISCPVSTFFDFKKAKASFLKLVDELIPGEIPHVNLIEGSSLLH